MSTPNSEYWQQRFTQLESAQNAIGKEAVAKIESLYRTAQRTIEGQITAWYERLAKNNEISMAEARKWLKGKELKEFHWDVGDYIEYGKDNAMNQMWMKELENASAKFHISRLEALNISLEQSLQELYLKEEKVVYNTLDDVYKEGYYRTMYELQKGFSVGFDVAKISNDYVAKVLAKPWAPDKYNFSERIWQSKTKLINTAHDEISKNILLGEDPRKAIDSIVKKLGTSRYNAGRLVMTEEAYFSSLAQGECLKDLDVEKYEILATLDSRTSEICQSLDGKTFEMKDYQAGATAPPFHVFCRSTTVPYFDKDYDLKGERITRGKDGETYYIPGDMRYNEWKNAFVNGDKSGYDLKEIDGTAHYSHKSAPAPKTESKAKTEPKIKKASSIEEAEKFALSNGVRHVDYSDLPLETANLLNEAAMTLPEDIRPAYIASSKNIEKAIGRKLSRSAKDFYGVHLDVMDLRFGEYPNIEYDFEGGQVVGISSSFKKLEKIKDAKLKVDKIYSEKHDEHTWFFNVDGTSTPFHEMGHVYADKKGIPKGFAEDAEKWFKETRCDMLKDVDEAWAEAWGGYHTQNPDLPDYIAKYIHNATNMPIDKSVESGIINNKIRTYNIHSNSNSRVYSTEELESAMCSSPLGSSMSDYIEQEGLSIEMNYDDNAPQNILGWISGKDISINVVNHKDAYDVSQTIVHECAHRRFNWDTTMEDEINCMIYDYLHIHESISQDAIKEIVSFVKSEYSDLPKGVLYGY